jgi:hypothetical protein
LLLLLLGAGPEVGCGARFERGEDEEGGEAQVYPRY